MGNGDEYCKPRYPQMHNINYIGHDDNPCLKAKEIEREHGRLKYEGKYKRSKQAKRI